LSSLRASFLSFLLGKWIVFSCGCPGKSAILLFPMKKNRIFVQKLKIMNMLTFLGFIGTGQVVLIVLVIVLLFGGKKIPELLKGLGKGVKSFKEGIKEAENEIKKEID
jgi:sec-independent protein translocase protein TatA